MLDLHQLPDFVNGALTFSCVSIRISGCFPSSIATMSHDQLDLWKVL